MSRMVLVRTEGWVVRAGSAVVAGAGFLALLGWVVGRPFLASLVSGAVPMAPSTAVLFVLYGIAALLRAPVPLHRRAYRIGLVVNSAGALVALLLGVLSSLGIRPEVELLGFAPRTVGSVPVGHMSPLTAAGFLLASVSFLVSLPVASSRPWRAKAAWGTAGALIAVFAVLLLAYLYGTPFLYGGAFIPPAAATCVAFAALGIALLALAGRQAGQAGSMVETPAGGPYPLVLLLAILTVVIVAVGGLFFRSTSAQYEAQVGRQLVAIAELKASELARWRAERLGDASILLDNRGFSALVRRALDHPRDREGREQLRQWLGKVEAHDEYDRAFLLDVRGVERMSVPDAGTPLSSVIARRTSEILRSRRVAFQDFYRDEHDQRVYLTLVIPILEGGAGSRALGVIGLRIDPEVYLYPSIRRWPAPSQTSETVLIRRDGSDALFLNELRFRTGAALSVRIPLTSLDVLAVKAALGQTGVVEGRDYRGVPTVGAVMAVPGSPWFLVARMDASEVNAPLRDRLWLSILLVGLFAAAATGGAAALWRQQHVRHLQHEYDRIRDTEARFRAVFDQSPDGTLLIDPGTGSAIEFNDAACRQLGYTREEFAALTIPDYEASETPEETQRHLQRALREGRADFETLQRTKSGEIRHVHVWASTLPLADGVVFHTIFEDITARVQAERQRAVLEGQLRQAQKMEAVGQLAGGIAHDFNNMLGVILANAELAMEAASDGVVKDGLSEIEHAANRARTLVAQLLGFSRRAPLALAPLDLDVAIRRVGSMLRRVIEESVEIRVDAPPLPYRVMADAGSIEQMLLNLATNARHAMPKGGLLRLGLSVKDIDDTYLATHPWVSPGRYGCVSVSDTGHGMDDETRQRVFEPFFTTKASVQGTGLGLAMVYGLMKQHQGFVHVYSELGQGTVFKLYFPAAAGEEPPQTTTQVPAVLRGGSETVLLVEDEEPLRRVAKRILVRAGYQVLEAADGKAGLELYRARQHDIDLVITDVVMPTMGGMELQREIVAGGSAPRILLMSGYSDRSARAVPLEAGATPILQKPWTISDLLSRVREILDGPGHGGTQGST